MSEFWQFLAKESIDSVGIGAAVPVATARVAAVRAAPGWAMGVLRFGVGSVAVLVVFGAAGVVWLRWAGVGAAEAIVMVETVVAVGIAGSLVWRMRWQEEVSLQAAANLSATAVALAAASERALQENAQRLDTTLTFMDQGLMMIDAAGIIVVCNVRVRDLLGLPEDLPIIHRPFDDLVQYQWDQLEFSRTEQSMIDFVRMGGIERSPAIYERLRPNGQVLEIRTTPLASGGYVRTYTDISVRRAAEGQIRQQAAYDDLTGLANRATFRRHLQGAIDLSKRAGRGFALLYLDLDRFKAINDSWGHPVGDRLLVAVAERIGGHARASDLLARIGGDEFAMVVSLVDVPREAAVLAQRVVEAVGAAFEIDGERLEVGVSIGVAMFPGDAASSDGLLRCADAALYLAKGAGRSVFRFYEGEGEGQREGEGDRGGG